jgi:hypothetical protein
MALSPFGKFLVGAFVEWIFTAPAQSSGRPQPVLPASRPALPPARKDRNMRPKVYCSNRLLRPKPFLLKWKIYWWAGRPVCKQCHRHYTANIRVIR